MRQVRFVNSLGPEDSLSIIHESSGWTLGTSWARPCVNTKHWPPQWALPPTTLLTDTNTKELKGVPLRSHTHRRMSQCAAAQSCVCTVYTAFVHGHCSLINGGWSVDENQEERTSLWLPARVHVQSVGSTLAGQHLRVHKPPTRVTEQHVIGLFVGKQRSEILNMSVLISLSTPIKNMTFTTIKIKCSNRYISIDMSLITLVCQRW